MEIAYAFFAEAVQLTGDGRVNILGADLNAVNVLGPPPWTAPPLSLLVAMRFAREECGRLYHFTAQMLSPDGTPIDPRAESDFITPLPETPDLMAKMTILLQLIGVALPVLGVYQMSIRVEDRERDLSEEKRIRLRPVEAAPQPQPA